jgi:hypothetical protein
MINLDTDFKRWLNACEFDSTAEIEQLFEAVNNVNDTTEDTKTGPYYCRKTKDDQYVVTCSHVTDLHLLSENSRQTFLNVLKSEYHFLN